MNVWTVMHGIQRNEIPLTITTAPNGPYDEGEPVVANGLALCRLHHGAFDRLFLGVGPDYVIQIRPDLLEEQDGPTLRHAIQGLHGQKIILPRRPVDRPSVASLEARYERFLVSAKAS